MSSIRSHPIIHQPQRFSQILLTVIRQTGPVEKVQIRQQGWHGQTCVAVSRHQESLFVPLADLDMAGTVYKRAIIAPDLDDKEWGPQGGKAMSVNNELPYSGLFTVVLQTGILRNVVVEGFEVSGVRAVGGLCGGGRVSGQKLEGRTALRL